MKERGKKREREGKREGEQAREQEKGRKRKIVWGLMPVCGPGCRLCSRLCSRDGGCGGARGGGGLGDCSGKLCSSSTCKEHCAQVAQATHHNRSMYINNK